MALTTPEEEWDPTTAFGYLSLNQAERAPRRGEEKEGGREERRDGMRESEGRKQH
jgi:hypothetical protein